MIPAIKKLNHHVDVGTETVFLSRAEASAIASEIVKLQATLTKAKRFSSALGNLLGTSDSDG